MSSAKLQESDQGVLCLIASYNTNLQGHKGLPQDLVDWLTPTLRVSKFLGDAHKRTRRAPDIIAVGFQELLPLHLGLGGLSKQIMQTRIDLILSEIEKHNGGARYALVASVVNVGVALLVFARTDTSSSTTSNGTDDASGNLSTNVRTKDDEGIADRITDVQTQWTGCGPCYLGNKGAVGVRLVVTPPAGRVSELREEETFTFVNAHLTAWEADRYLQKRLNDYDYIVSTLLFRPTPSDQDYNQTTPRTIYDTTHLFFFGDLNFRVVLPKSIKNAPSSVNSTTSSSTSTAQNLSNRDLDQLTIERRKPTSQRRALAYLREGPFWEFDATYKYELGSVTKYSEKRTPSWTDRILYASRFDPVDLDQIAETTGEDDSLGSGSSQTQTQAHKSVIENLVYTSVPSYTTSDHKPIVALLHIHPSPSPASASNPLTNTLSAHPTYARTLPSPDPLYVVKRYFGRVLGWILGWTGWVFVGLGGGMGPKLGVVNFLVGILVWRWWNVGGAGRGRVEGDGNV